MVENEEPPARLVNSFLYLRIDTIVSKCDCKFIYGKIMTEYLSIKQISENQEEWVLFLNKENLEFVGRYLCLF